MTPAERKAELEKRLRGDFSPTALVITDESHRHVGHAGARDGRGHFHVRIVSAQFAGKNMVARHRMVYQCVGTLMETDIHALSLETLSDDEA